MVLWQMLFIPDDTLYKERERESSEVAYRDYTEEVEAGPEVRKFWLEMFYWEDENSDPWKELTAHVYC